MTVTITETAPNGDTALFSANGLHRYLLRRRIVHKDGKNRPPKTVTFCMLNPSTANAFKNDNTVARCVRFATLWDATHLEVVNLFALRTPYPKDLKAAPAEMRGADAFNDSHIIGALERSDLFMCAWGNDGELANRAWCVRENLRANGRPLFHLGTSGNGCPKHPLARGKSFIPYTQPPVVWAP